MDWTALSAVAVPIAVVDDTGHIRYCNRRWREADPSDGFRVGARYDACSDMSRAILFVAERPQQAIVQGGAAPSYFRFGDMLCTSSSPGKA